MCKGAIARHGIPVFKKSKNSIRCKKQHLVQKMCKEMKLEKAHSVLWQEVQIDIDHT